jgi:Pyridoxamine 5'-phosphate oxidase
MQPETERFILDVLQAHNILTLATVREDGYPQATRVGVAARKQPPPNPQTRPVFSSYSGSYAHLILLAKFQRVMPLRHLPSAARTA